jgi:Ser-tRNA(Ala) deacylase AlaX
VLSQTLFHPQGGGQMADTGQLCHDINVRLAEHAREAVVVSAEQAAVAVTDVRYDTDRITVLHTVASGHGLEPGMTVMMMVDGARRRLNSRLHSAGHLLADVVAEVAPGLVARTAHHWPGEARVEFEGEGPDLAALEERIRAAMDAAIAEDRPVAIDYGAEGQRLVAIGAGAPIPCGGTHVRSSAALSGFRLKGVTARKGLVRVSYDVAADAAGDRA